MAKDGIGAVGGAIVTFFGLALLVVGLLAFSPMFETLGTIRRGFPPIVFIGAGALAAGVGIREIVRSRRRRRDGDPDGPHDPGDP